MRRVFVAIVTGLSLTASAHAQSAKNVKPVWPDEGPFTWAPRPTVADITANDLRTRLYGFANDSMQGRRMGELGNYKGTDYIAREFKRLGLKPAGDSGTYFQNMPYGPIGFDSASSQLIAGGATLRSKTDWIPQVPNAAAGLGGRADLTNVPTVFAGRWGDTSMVLDASAFRGKVAVFIASPPARAAVVLRCDSVIDKFGAAAAVIGDSIEKVRGTDRGAAGRGAGGPRDMRAVNAGAVGVLLVGLDSVSRATVSAAFTPRIVVQPTAASATAVPSASISRAAAAVLFNREIDGAKVGDAGQPITASWNYAWSMSKTPARNVVAILPGSDPSRAGEYVLVSAHNDHNGVNATAVDHDSLRAVNTVTRRQGANDPVCRPTAEQQVKIDSIIKRARSIRPPRPDSIMNGADDDGSGTVVMLEIAEKFAHEKPSRSIVFVSHEGEEAGLLGSKWFVDHPTIPLASIVAAHNMDMVGKGRVDQVKFGGPTSIQMLGARRLSREFGDVIDSVNAVRSEVMAIDKTWEVPSNPLNRFCRSDQVNYVTHNVPVTYFSLGYAQDYHQLTDEPQYIDYEHAAKVGRFVHDVMSAISERKERLKIAGPDPTMPSCGR